MDLNEIQQHKEDDQLLLALRSLGTLLETAHGGTVNEAWQRHCLPSENLLWQCGLRCCGAKASTEEIKQFKATVADLKDNVSSGDVRRYCEATSLARFLVQVSLAEAAAEAAVARRLNPDGTASAPYREDAKAALRQAGPPFSDETLGDAIVDLGVNRLLGRLPPEAPRGETWILLVNRRDASGDSGNSGQKVSRSDRAVRFISQMVPGETAALLPDPWLGVLSRPADPILETVQAAWRHWCDAGLCEAGKQGVWWLQADESLDYVTGQSGDASIYASFRSALEDIPLAPAVAISARVNRHGEELQLEAVDHGPRKWRLARRTGCDTLLVHADTKQKAEGGVPQAEHDALPKLVPVSAFEEAWQQINVESLILNAYRKAVRRKWLEPWSKYIRGDRVWEIEQGELVEVPQQAAGEEGNDAASER
jgi:hypothetical protein